MRDIFYIRLQWRWDRLSYGSPPFNKELERTPVKAIIEELIKNLQKQVGGLEKEVKEWKDMAITISKKNSQKTKNPTKPNKQKVGFMKKHKPKK